MATEASKSTKTFDAARAASFLMENAGTTSIGRCAKYVRMSIEAGGISTAGRPVAAQDYVNFLPTIGFNEIKDTEPHQVGDLCVINHGKYGHICMWCGSQWISDFKQRRPVPYNSGVNGVWFYRFNGIINNSMNHSDGKQYNEGIVAFERSEYLPQDVDLIKSNIDVLFPKLTFIKLSLINELVEWYGYDLGIDDIKPEMSIKYDNKEWVKNYKLYSDNLNQSSFDSDYSIGDLIVQYYAIGKMGNTYRTYPDPDGSGDTGGAGGVNIGNIQISGDDEKCACQLAAAIESGKDFNKPLTGKELTGYKLRGEKLNTYGFGQVYMSNGQTAWQNYKGGGPFTDEELRSDFIKQIRNELNHVKTIPYNFTPYQKAVLCHVYHSAPKAFFHMKRNIMNLGHIPSAEEFKNIRLAYYKTCRNWELYAKGWTNATNREAQWWVKA